MSDDQVQRAVAKVKTKSSYRTTYYVYLTKRMIQIQSVIEHHIKLPWVVSCNITDHLYHIEGSSLNLFIKYLVDNYDYIHSTIEKRSIEATLRFLLPTHASNTNATIFLAVMMNTPSKANNLRGRDLEIFNSRTMSTADFGAYSIKMILEFMSFSDNEFVTMDFSWV